MTIFGSISDVITALTSSDFHLKPLDELARVLGFGTYDVKRTLARVNQNTLITMMVVAALEEDKADDNFATTRNLQRHLQSSQVIQQEVEELSSLRTKKRLDDDLNAAGEEKHRQARKSKAYYHKIIDDLHAKYKKNMKASVETAILRERARCKAKYGVSRATTSAGTGPLVQEF